MTSRLHSLMRSTRFAGLVDQGVYSLAAFAQTALYARLLSPDEFGLFAMVLSTVLLTQTLQRCVVVLPMVVSLADRGRAGIRGWFSVNGIVLGAALLVLLAGAVVMRGLGMGGGKASAAQLLGLAALALPTVFLYEFVRRALYVEAQHGHVPLQAAVYLLLQIAGTLVVGYTFGSALAAVLSLALANLAGATVGALALNWRRKPDEAGARELLVRYRADMGWSLAAAAPYAGYNTAMPLLVGLLAGPTSAGLFSATRLLLAPITTLIAAIDSVDKPKAARGLRDDGAPGLRRSLYGTWRSMLRAGGPYLLLAGVFHAQIIRAVLGAKVAAHAGAAWMWLAVGLLMMLGQPLETGLLVLRRARWYFWSRLIAAAASALALWLAIARLGHSGGILAVAVGWLISTAAAAIMLRRALGSVTCDAAATDR